MKRTKTRRLLRLIDLALGIWLSLASVVQFIVFLAGHPIWESNRVVAALELSVASAVLIYYSWRVFRWFRSKRAKYGA